jgi:hypothetical protein
MAVITINSKKFGTHKVLLDNSDLKLVSGYNWWLSKSSYSNTFYAATWIKINNKRIALSMHRLFLNLKNSNKKKVNHINGNGLDNRRKNIRECTHEERQANQHIPKNNQSGYKGVYWKQKNGMWCAQIGLHNKHLYLGLFDSPINAAIAYNEAAKKYFGEFAKLNNV